MFGGFPGAYQQLLKARQGTTKAPLEVESLQTMSQLRFGLFRLPVYLNTTRKRAFFHHRTHLLLVSLWFVKSPALLIPIPVFLLLLLLSYCPIVLLSICL